MSLFWDLGDLWTSLHVNNVILSDLHIFSPLTVCRMMFTAGVWIETALVWMHQCFFFFVSDQILILSLMNRSITLQLEWWPIRSWLARMLTEKVSARCPTVKPPHGCLSFSSVVSDEARQVIWGFSLCLGSAGWKLSPMMGAMYGPELYAGEAPYKLFTFLLRCWWTIWDDRHFLICVLMWSCVLLLRRHQLPKFSSSNQKCKYRGCMNVRGCVLDIEDAYLQGSNH